MSFLRPLILKSGTLLFVGVAILALGTALSSRLLFSADPEMTYYAGELGDDEIYLLDVNRGLTANLTHNPGNDGVSAWSPDGQQIVFYSRRDSRTDLYLMNADSTQPRRLAASGGPGTYPAWSPDGQWIAFASLQPQGDGIYRIHPDGSGQQRLTTFRASLIAWSPDSQRIAFTSDCDNNCDIYVMNADGSHIRHVTRSGEFDVYPAWSPDSQRIAFMSNRAASLDLYMMDADCDDTRTLLGCDVNRLTDSHSFEGYPAWSPDGKWIAFSSDRDGNFEIYKLPADCYRQPEGCADWTRLTYRPANDVGPVWSSDGRQLAFISLQDVYVMNADGSDLRRLVRSVERDQFLTWRP